MEPDLTLPKQGPPPRPNAKDFYIKAGSYLEKHFSALSVLAHIDPNGVGATGGVGPYAPSRSELIAAFRECSPALAEMRKGFRYGYGGIGWSQEFGWTGEMRHLARVLRTECKLRCNEGDWRGAVGSVADGLRLARDIRIGDGWGGMSDSITCEAIILDGVVDVVGHLDGDNAKELLRKMERLDAERMQLAESIRVDKWQEIRRMRGFMNSKNWPDWFIGYAGGAPKGWFPAVRRKLHVYSIGKKRLVQNYVDYMDQFGKYASVRYGAGITPPVAADPFTKSAVKYLSSYPYWLSETRRALLEVALAVQAYRADHGTYPPNLPSLMPTYLKQIPEDPFAANGTVRYRIDSNGFTIYSIGPDGIDDMGMKTRSENPVETEKGDIVFRVDR